jgi:hypothetical protein
METARRDVLTCTFPGLLLLLLSGCGGGGSAMQLNPPASTPLPAPPPETALAPAEPFMIYGTALGASSDGNTYVGSYSETPNDTITMFDGQEANSSTILLTINENGSPIITETETTYYLENPYQPLGMTFSYNGEQFNFQYNSTDPLPSSLTVGTSGQLGSGTFYAANTNNAVGSLTESYSVTISETNWMLLSINATGTLNGQSISQSISYFVNAGSAMGVTSAEILVNGTTLQFDSSCNGCWDY